MKITIFGSGYVGLVTGACLADVGHEILCVDLDQGKVDGLNNGIIPIYEPGLERKIKFNRYSPPLAPRLTTTGLLIYLRLGLLRAPLVSI